MQWVSLIAVLAIGCAGDNPTNAERACDAECNRVLACDLRPTNDWCRGGCEDARDGVWRLRSKVIDSYSDCIGSVRCEALLDETVFSRCWDNALEGVGATRQTQDFCSAHSLSLFDCGYTYPVAECEADFAPLSGEYLEELLECSRTDTCDDAAACRNAASDR